mmetsp:Transcript_5712/g.8288  ORF Transcript_5712/g.8288 Transcript_5712/m.8288 type:complete len:1108 (+) Transcript_5712:146-3469(+)
MIRSDDGTCPRHLIPRSAIIEMAKIFLFFLVLLTPVSAGSFRSSNELFEVNSGILPHKITSTPLNSHLRVRGGSDQDEERYSRQVYALGKRAHGLIRTSKVYLDGPPSSGLLYECAKNLVLSGVGSITILKPSSQKNKLDDDYHCANFDDLGRSYQQAARSELEVDQVVDEHTLLQNYLRRLNPSVKVSVMTLDEVKKCSEEGVFVCIDRAYTTQVQWNNWCRKANIKFVSIETAGLYGKVFCDFGNGFKVFDRDGEDPLQTPLGKAKVLIETGEIRVNCIDGEKHDVSQGDLIDFRDAAGNSIGFNCTVMKVINPKQFLIEISGSLSANDFCEEINQRSTSFSRLKVPEDVDFNTLDSVLSKAYSDDSLFSLCDLDKTFDRNRRSAILSCFLALGEFIGEEGFCPTIENLEVFSGHASKSNAQQDHTTLSWKRAVRCFTKTCRGKFCPVQAVIGAIGAQEALKAASGLYYPVKQFLLFDCDELIIEDENALKSTETMNTSANGQTYVIGERLCERLSQERIFVVGAGAIGCELLKNLASMGIKNLIITDMDTIEKSNLSRQLLFRDRDIGVFKSVAAQNTISMYKPDIDIEVHTSKVGDDHGPFDEDFWSKKVDIVLNALDNIDARLYIDSQCVAHGKALVDAGTLGSKGNVQVVVPHQSESYGASVDPPEPAIPVCTIKNFPYLISHTIQWGKELFDAFFTQRPKRYNELSQLLKDNSPDSVTRKIISELGMEASRETSRELLEDVESSIVEDISTFRDEAITWAATCADGLFRQEIEVLLMKHPVDSVDEDGEPFWSVSRRVPKSVYYGVDAHDPQQMKINDNLVAFVQNCARLRIESCNPHVAKDRIAHITREEAVSALKTSNLSPEDKGIHARIQFSKDLLKDEIREWGLIGFEKDDDSNGHVDFVTAASNLRALCYGIAPVDTMETRRVAGQIIPAMITTTALVSAFSCLEMVKLVQKASLEVHRNAFVNMATPFLAFTRPMPAEEVFNIKGRRFTIWDRTIIKESKRNSKTGGITIRGLLARIIKKTGLDDDLFQVSSISYGPYLIYANFMHEHDDELLSKPVWDVIKEALMHDDEFSERDSDDAKKIYAFRSPKTPDFR